MRNAPPNKKKGAGKQRAGNGKQSSPTAYDVSEEDDEGGLLKIHNCWRTTT